MKELRKFTVSVAILMAVSASVRADSAFELADLPKPVQNQLLQMFSGEIPASSNSPYNDSDSISPGLPMRRLVFSARRGDVYFIHYAHGGYSWHTHLVGIQLNRWGTLPTINVAFYEQFGSLEETQQALSSFKFHSPEIGSAVKAGALRVEY